MDGVKTCTQYFVATVEMMQVGTTIIATGVTVTMLIKGRCIAFILGITDFYDAVGDKQVTVSRITRWHYAVKHIHATTHAFDQIFRLTNTHQITRFVFWDLRANMFQNTVHVFFWLTDRQTAHSVTIKANIYQP